MLNGLINAMVIDESSSTEMQPFDQDGQKFVLQKLIFDESLLLKVAVPNVD
jgi:hypothetical protein